MKSSQDYPKYPPRILVRITERLRLFFLRAHQRFTHPQVVMWERIHQFWLAAGIGVVAELGVADLLKGGPMQISELSVKTSSHEASLYRLMRMLASQGIFRELPGRKFRTTRLARPLEDDQIRYLVLVHLNPAHFRIFAELREVVKSGKAVSVKDHAGDLFGHIAGDEQRNDYFNRAMSSASRMQIPALLPVFHFGRFRKIVDVGGGQGLFMAAILEKYPDCEGTVFDLPQALERAQEVIAEHDLETRLKVESGDFFQAVPGGADLYMMKNVLHDWKDEEALKILSRVHEAMGQTARLLVVEAILDESNDPSFGKMTDLLMMASAGGMERSLAGFRDLLEQAGFRIRKIHRTISPHSILEAEKI